MKATGGSNISSTAQIGDGVIVNADINASASITHSKMESDARARANHSGSQAASTISDFAARVGDSISTLTNKTIDAEGAGNSISNIANGNIKANAGIVDTKLAQIATAGKVHGSAITNLDSLPSGAGVIPQANLPSFASLAETINTNPTTNTWYSYIANLIASSTSAMLGWTVAAMTLVVADGAGGFFRLLSNGGSSSIISKIPGTGSVDNYDSNKRIIIKWRLKLSDTNNIKSWGLAQGAASIFAAQTGNNDVVRFVENAGTLYANTGNSVAPLSTDISAGITRTNWNTFAIDFQPGVSARFYINGTLVATHTTNLPTAAGNDLLLAYGLNTTAQSIDTFPPIISLAI